MADPILGTLTPTDPAQVLAKAAETLGVPVPRFGRTRLERVARAIYRAEHGGPWKRANQKLFRSYARAAIAAHEGR